MCRKNKEELLVPKNFYDILSILEYGRTTIKVEWIQLKEQTIDMIDVSEQLINAAHKNGFTRV